jgi:hypothetical protein
MKENVARCGECNKMVGRKDEGIISGLCETLFHCTCQNNADKTCKLLSHDRDYFHCGRLDTCYTCILL